MQEAGERDVLVAFLGQPHRIDTRSRQNQLKKALESIPLSDSYLAQQMGWILYLEGTTDLAILRKLALRLKHPAAQVLEGRVPLVTLGTNKPGDARNHFDAMREAMPQVAGIAVFDRLPNPATELSTMRGLEEIVWQQREIENYLVTRKSLLAYIVSDLSMDDLIDHAQIQSRQKILVECIEELEKSLKTARRPDPWGPDAKVTDEFLDPLFANYYECLGTPQQTYKRDYHGLAESIPLEHLDAEISVVLDAILATSNLAKPVT